MVGYILHEGKQALQARTGTTNEAARAIAAGWVGTAISSSGDSQIADPDQKEVYVTSVDRHGLVWASVVMGDMPGFVTSSPATPDERAGQLTINSGARGFLTYEGDPLVENSRRANAPLGVLLMGYKSRRRYRIDGWIVSRAAASDSAPPSSLTLDVTMAMGNCPKYLHVRELVGEERSLLTPTIEQSTTLSKAQMELIGSSPTFILGTFADGPNGGADASNRGGNPGFVQALDESTIVFPDYKGNNLYLSLGNIEVNPRAGLLFINRETGDVLQVSGEAHIVWGDPRYGGTATGTKYVHVKVLKVVDAKGANPLRMKMQELSPFNPPLTATMATTMASKKQKTHADGREDEIDPQQQQKRSLVRCKEVVDVAKGVKSFRFEATGCCGGGDLPFWTPGQFATFYFPVGEGSSVREDNSECRIFTLPRRAGAVAAAPPNSREWKKEEGQGEGEADPVDRTWTITSVYERGSPLEITVQAKEGGVSELMHRRLKAGYLARVTVGGDFTLPERLGAAPVRDDKILLLSAGIGITPMIGALRWLRQREKKRCSDPNRCLVPAHPDIVAIHVTRSTDLVPYLDEIEQAAQPQSAQQETPHGLPPSLSSSHTNMSNNTNTDISYPVQEEQPLRVVLAITRFSAAPRELMQGSGKRQGRVAGAAEGSSMGGFSVVYGRPDVDMLQREVLDVAERSVFMCGPDGFMTTMDVALKKVGVQSSAIHQEDFHF